MANPKGAKAREPYQRSISDRLLPKGRKNFDEEGLRRSQLSLLPTIGERFGEWFEASSYGKKRLVMLRGCRGIPAL